MCGDEPDDYINVIYKDKWPLQTLLTYAYPFFLHKLGRT